MGESPQVGPVEAVTLAADVARAALDAVPMPVLLLEPVLLPDGRPVDLRFTYANSRSDDFGTSRMALVGRSVGELWPRLLGVDLVARALEVHRTGVPWAFHASVQVPLGAPTVISGDVVSFGDGLLVALRDVTDQNWAQRAIAATRPERDPVDGLPLGTLLLRDIGEFAAEHADRDRALWELEHSQRIARMGSWRWDAVTDRMWWSPELRRMLGSITVQSTIGGLVGLLSHDGPAHPIVLAWEQAVAREEAFEVEYERVAGSSMHQWVVCRGEPIRDRHGVFIGMRGTAQDVTGQRLAERALAESEEGFRLAFESSPLAKVLASADPRDPGRIQRVNHATCRLMGRTADRLVGGNLLEWLGDDHRDVVRTQLVGLLTAPHGDAPPHPDAPPQARTADDVGPREVPLLADRPDPVWGSLTATAVRDATGSPLYLLITLEDVTARRHAENLLLRQARSDQLTDLPNRLALIDELGVRLAQDPERTVVLFLDLDDFKTVNDSLGHLTGDRLLAAVAQRLSDGLAPGDFAARWGGDEFVVLSRGDRLSAAATADRLRAAVSGDVVLDGHDLTTTTSIGVAVSAVDSTPEGLLRDADIAMYRAKAAGKDRWALADSAGQAGAMRRLTMVSALRRALDADELLLLYQPVVELATGALVGVEALLRWAHPTRGLLVPSDFLDVAETSALVVPLGDWVLRTACADAVGWLRRHGAAAPTVAVNVSARQLGHEGLHDRVAAVLAATGLPPDRLFLELTEREVVATSGAEVLDLKHLHQSGVRLAVDDFGTGYAGFDYLRRLPVDVLKLDRSFVVNLGLDPTDTAITVSLVALGQALGLTVVAEGVETKQQFETLRDLGCPHGQGLLWAEPVLASRIDDLVGTVLGPGLSGLPSRA